MWTVAVFLMDRAYGGPEEGGWWYDCGTPADEYAQYTKGFTDEIEAIKYSAELDQIIEKEGLNEGRREIGSVLSTGRYEAWVSEGNPKRFPLTRPHYE